MPRFVNASVQTPNKLLRMVAEEICGQSARKPHAERDFKVIVMERVRHGQLQYVSLPSPCSQILSDSKVQITMYSHTETTNLVNITLMVTKQSKHLNFFFFFKFWLFVRNMQRSWELNLNKRRRGQWMLQQGNFFFKRFILKLKYWNT